ncbi:MAG: DNA methyltransferase [Petrotogales bacterium]
MADIVESKLKENLISNKYKSFRYSVAPLKQTNETILIFHKPCKTGSVLHDCLAYEEGDDTIAVGALDIENNRVAIDPASDKSQLRTMNRSKKEENDGWGMNDNKSDKPQVVKPEGRYPAQTFVNGKAAAKLDEQSGVSKSGKAIKHKSGGKNFGSDTPKPPANDIGYQDIGGCSKVLFKCDFTEEELNMVDNIYFYQPKVSKKERNAGCGELKDSTLNRMREDKSEPTGLNREGRFAPIQVKNNHPTVKPISLSERILRLFKTPNSQRILIPFCGSGSEIIGALKAGFKNIEACEINPEYIKIAEARVKYWYPIVTQGDLFE